jgi:hypothetical protein
MAKFKYNFRRTYSITEGFERIIDAPSRAEADAAARNLATEFDDDCPDDCSEDERGDYEIGSFATEFEIMVLGNCEPDFHVASDGQCHPYGGHEDAL